MLVLKLTIGKDDNDPEAMLIGSRCELMPHDKGQRTPHSMLHMDGPARPLFASL
jgi:hypothetical protein